MYWIDKEVNVGKRQMEDILYVTVANFNRGLDHRGLLRTVTARSGSSDEAGAHTPTASTSASGSRSL